MNMGRKVGRYSVRQRTMVCRDALLLNARLNLRIGCSLDALVKFLEKYLEEGYTFKSPTCQNSRLDNVKIPLVRLPEKPKSYPTEEYDETIEELVEWVGMAGLHAQR